MFPSPLEHLAQLMNDAGFDVVSNEYVLRETVNKKEGLCVPRVFVQGKFMKREQTEKVTTPIEFCTGEPFRLNMPGDLNNSNNDIGTVT